MCPTTNHNLAQKMNSVELPLKKESEILANKKGFVSGMEQDMIGECKLLLFV